MSATYPSPAITLVDIGEVQNFKAEFFYNFFVPDEVVSDDGEIPTFLQRKSSESFDASYINDLSRKVPRYVRLSFTPAKPLTHFTPSNEFHTDTNNKAREKGFSIEKHYEKLVYEDSFTGNSYVPIEFYDNMVDNKLFLAVSGSVTQQSSLFNARKNKQISAEVKKLKDRTTSAVGSLMDGARLLNAETPPDIDSDFITKALVNMDKLGASLIDVAEQKDMRRNTFERIKDIKINARLNGAIIGDAVRAIVNSSSGLLADDFAPHLKGALSIQSEVAAGRPSGQLSLSDYESSLEPIFEKEHTGNNFNETLKVIGYVIEKTAVTPEGVQFMKDPIFLEAPDISSVLDPDVAYGTSYFYEIRTITLLTLTSTSNVTDDIMDATYLVASKPMTANVDCVEHIPPPPPVDFNVMYDYQRRVPRLIWNLPVNPQRDVKQFQVFRRKSISDPFMLLKVYDFNDSDVRIENYEQVMPFLIEELSSPLTTYDDFEFDRDGSFIYAVCCIDAHGLTSNLSVQFEVSFDKYKNRLVKKLISNSGAPKAYPNLYLLHDTFVDVIKDSGHERLKIYFDPEFLDIFNTDGDDLNLLATDRTDGRYKLQIINTDLQQAQTLDIIINDLRLTKSESEGE